MTRTAATTHKSLSDRIAEARAESEAEERRTCLHEAAHCVVAHVYNLDARGVAVYALTDQGATHWSLDAVPVVGPEANFLRAVEGMLQTDMAGVAAGRVFKFPDVERGCEFDRRNAVTLVRGFPEILKRYGSAERAITSALAQATSLLQRHRDAVERFADALYAAGRLDGRRYVEAMAAAFQEPTPTDVLIARRSRFEQLHAQGKGQDEAWTIANRENPEHPGHTKTRGETFEEGLRITQYISNHPGCSRDDLVRAGLLAPLTEFREDG